MSMAEPTYFTITGLLDGVVQTLGWVEGRGFSADETAGQAALDLILRRTEVCVTTTGPCFRAADSPAYVAFVTARTVFDAGATLRFEGDAVDGIEETLDELMTVPGGSEPHTSPSSPSTNDRASASTLTPDGAQIDSSPIVSTS